METSTLLTSALMLTNTYTLHVMLLLLAGALAGLLAGLLGVGGGIILVPAFYYMFSHFGYDTPQLMQICVATSLATIIVTSCRSAWAHHKKAAVDWPTLRSCSLGLAAGSCLGVYITTLLSADSLRLVFAIFALALGAHLTLSKERTKRSTRLPPLALPALFAPIIGCLSALMGIGGGTFAIPSLMLFGSTPHKAVATASGFGVLIALPSVFGFAFLDTNGAPPFTVGAINLLAFALVIPMTLLTAPLGAKLAHRTNPRHLKRFFGVFLTLVALNMMT